MPKNVYIDLDGTLTDPFEGISNCICHALDRLGEPRPPRHLLRRYIGPPLLTTFGELVGTSRAQQALVYYRERFGDAGWRENVPYPGIHDALETLNRMGHRCFVATTKPHVFARRIVRHFEMADYFQKVYGSELDGTRTDKTELLRYAQAEREGERESVMIGDRHHDMIGAINNSLRGIGVTYGYGTAAELLEAGADAVAGSPGELPGLL